MATGFPSKIRQATVTFTIEGVMADDTEIPKQTIVFDLDEQSEANFVLTNHLEVTAPQPFEIKKPSGRSDFTAHLRFVK